LRADYQKVSVNFFVEVFWIDDMCVQNDITVACKIIMPGDLGDAVFRVKSPFELNRPCRLKLVDNDDNVRPNKNEVPKKLFKAGRCRINTSGIANDIIIIWVGFGFYYFAFCLFSDDGLCVEPVVVPAGDTSFA